MLFNTETVITEWIKTISLSHRVRYLILKLYTIQITWKINWIILKLIMHFTDAVNLNLIK